MSGWEQELFPALTTWRQTRAASPDRHQLRDALWRAACQDAAAMDLLTEGHTQLALDAWREARRIEDLELDGPLLAPADEARWEALLAAPRRAA